MGFWTDENAGICKTMWAEGRSASEIGARLGCTRNAVISKVHRTGMVGPNSWSSREAINKPKTQKKPRVRLWSPKRPPPEELTPPSLPEPSEVATTSFAVDGAKTFVEADFSRECRWPLGEPGHKDFSFCCAPVNEPPYCTHHARIAFNH